MASYFNYPAFLEHEHNDVDFAKSLLSSFLDIADSYFGAVELAVSTRDADALARSAHKLKGALGTFLVEEVRSKAHELELAGKNHTLDTAAVALPELGAMLAVLKEEMRACVQA